MIKIRIYKHFYKLIFSVFLFSPNINAQITVQNTLTPEQIVQNVLLGSGITVSNITINGSTLNAKSVSQQVGTFTKGTSTFPIDNGVIISTGRVLDVPGNSSAQSSSNIVTSYTDTDPDLASISGTSINDALVLEFDFLPSGDSLSFNYCFGSEEYPNYVDQINDVFGFFISGPGFSGAYFNSAENIALLPSSTTPVTINNVNNGDANSGPCTNCAYYIDNTGNVYGSSVTFNGMTTILTAVSNLVCGQTYHIKIAIGDAVDAIYDSGVFLQAQSFSSNQLILKSESDFKGTFVDTLVQEGCTSTLVQLIRPTSANGTQETYHFDVTGTADASDFAPFADSVVFNIGQDTALILLDPISDAITEGQEWIQFKYINLTGCGSSSGDSIRIYVTDQYNLTYTLEDTTKITCSTINPNIEILNLDNSVPPFVFLWENTSNLNPTTFTNSGINNDSTYFNVSITDGCGWQYSDSILIINEFDTTHFTILPNDTIINTCPTNILSADIITSNMNNSPFDYLWSNGETSSSVTNLSNAGIDGSVVTYYVSLTNACGITSNDSIKIINQFAPPSINLSPGSSIIIPCLFDSTMVTAQTTGGTKPYTYTWSDGQTGTDSTNYLVDVSGINNQTYNYTVDVLDACGRTNSVSGSFQIVKTLAISTNQTPTSNCVNDGTANVSVIGETGNSSYEWSLSSNFTNPISQTSSINNVGSNWYYVNVTDDVCNSIDSIFIAEKPSVKANINTSNLIGTSPITFNFSNTSENSTNYSWDFGNGDTKTSTDLTDQSSYYANSGIYTIYLTAINGPCSDIDSITIQLFDQPIVMNVPNVLTPNNDGINDTYFIEILYADEVELIITNRWGQVVFNKTSANPIWDGKTENGDVALPGTYFYSFKATALNGVEIDGTGFLQLITE
jgi:gliding motility-associated-like protein